MKKFTLRMADTEAEALEQMAYCYGLSKNDLITKLIGKEYDNFIGGENAPERGRTISKSENVFMDVCAMRLFDLARSLEESNYPDVKTIERLYSRALLIVNYSLENPNGEFFSSGDREEAQEILTRIAGKASASLLKGFPDRETKANTANGN